MDESKLVGRRIVAARSMTTEEMDREGWHVPRFGPMPTVLILDDGTTLLAGSDEEGNEPGTLMGYGPDDELFKLA